MSLLNVLKSYWTGKVITVRSMMQIFDLDKVDARVRLQELAYEEEVLREVKQDVFIASGDRENFEKAFEREFSDHIKNEQKVEEISEALY